LPLPRVATVLLAILQGVATQFLARTQLIAGNRKAKTKERLPISAKTAKKAIRHPAPLVLLLETARAIASNYVLEIIV
jgi:hypothetical protein